MIIVPSNVTSLKDPPVVKASNPTDTTTWPAHSAGDMLVIWGMSNGAGEPGFNFISSYYNSSVGATGWAGYKIAEASSSTLSVQGTYYHRNLIVLSPCQFQSYANQGFAAGSTDAYIPKPGTVLASNLCLGFGIFSGGYNNERVSGPAPQQTRWNRLTGLQYGEFQTFVPKVMQTDSGWLQGSWSMTNGGLWSTGGFVSAQFVPI